MIQIIASALGYQTASQKVKNVKRQLRAIPVKDSEKLGGQDCEP